MSTLLEVPRPAATTAPPASPPVRERAGGAVLNVFTHGILLTWAAMVVLPLAWAVLSSLKTSDEVLADPWSLPSSPRWENFVNAWTTADIGRYFLNTTIVVAVGSALTLGMGALVAYVVARYTFRGNRAVYYLFVAGMTFPTFLAIVPLFFIARGLGLADSLLGLALIYSVYSLPFAVFFLTAYFRTLPTSLAEAAFIDGCGHWGTFLRIMLPVARPGLVSVGIFVVLGQWNQYLLPLILQSSPDKYVLTQGLANLAVSQGYAGDWSALFAGLTISILPVLVVYLSFQRQIQTGMVAGALK
ncbi:carbohydrate ABC transporter permease [Nonomuraea soli]|uniref:N-acetylglucosamine transport system permease protein n=1 Tax=Nonomuraea soli TaxID=1032476 RepID=A0A7W0CRZ8_9ACTN|nr:carbohydrate ABC transporter permease [Nonomuraea soli]MBA2896114.1 N-acetylglucosamine transport system permease protein [Nonomuraea soli]